MVGALNGIHRALDLLFLPFAKLNPFWGLFAISIVTGVALVFAYKYTSNQAAIKHAKDLIKGHLLESWIYREQVLVMLKAQAKTLWANVIYVGANMKPFAVMLPPVLILVITLNFRYGMRPLKPGEVALFKTERSSAVSLDQMDERLTVPDGVEIDGPPARIESTGETYWRLKATKPGDYKVKVTASGTTYEKSVEVGEMGVRVAPVESASLAKIAFYPGEARITSGPLKTVEIAYPSDAPRVPFTGWRPHWILQYLVLSIIVGFALKGPLKVEI